MHFEYTEEMERFLRDNVEKVSYHVLADMFYQEFGVRRHESTILSKCQRMGIAPERKKRGWPKGKKRGPLSKEEYEKKKKTFFTSENHPKSVPLGTESIAPDGKVFVKVRSNAKAANFEARSRVVWREHHGEIPEGYSVMHLNGDVSDDRIENLMLVSKSEIVRTACQNKISTNGDVTKANILVARLDEKIAKLEGKKK